MWMTIQQYADKQGISYQGAYKAFKKYGADLMAEGHVKEEGRTTMIDGYAADFLASKRRPKGSSLVRTVKLEAQVRKSFDIADTHGESKVNTVDKISYVKEEISKIRKVMDSDAEKMIEIMKRNEANNKELNKLEDKLTMLCLELVEKEKNRNINDMVIMLKENRI